MAAAILILLLLLLLLGPVYSDVPAPPMSDASALLLLKDSFTNASALSSWAVGSDGSGNPCDPDAPWVGIVCFHGILTGLRLSDMGLGGTIDVAALSHFKGLRSLSFSRNSFSGAIPPLGRLDALKSIYLEDNRFSGEIPDDLFVPMNHLKKLWLSGNNFTGPIPSSLANAKPLLELHLDGNQFSGPIPDLALKSLTSFNVSNNKLQGPIPETLSKFNESSFDGNPDLCGGNLMPCEPLPPLPQDPPVPHEQPSEKLAGLFVILILIAFVLALGMAGKRRGRQGSFVSLRAGAEQSEDDDDEGEVAVVSTYHRRSGSSAKAGGGNYRGGPAAGGLVVVNDSKGPLGMPDLMKASAEVLGTGGLGSAYKAVMPNGSVVAVKRTKEMNKVGRETFDVEMRRLGRLCHPNVLPPLAYHYGTDERLLVFEYMSKGSLLYILHGDRGQDHAALDWATRLKIIRGIARGMAYLHAELNSLNVPHGNLKSGNVLLTGDFEPLLVDYGFISLVNPSQASQTLFAYKSPESLRVSPKSDVYCLGIVILEVLTGKFPSQYLNNTKGGTDVVRWVTSAFAEGREAELLDPEITVNKDSIPDMERLLRVGEACVESDPEKRPDMREASARVEEVAVAAEKGLLGSNQWRSKSIGERSARRSDDGIAYAIS